MDHADARMKRTRALRAATWALLGLAGLAGCESATTRRIADSESILAASAPQTPLDAAREMIDQYDADKRFRGTLLVSNAPWGGEDVYLAVYVDQVQNDPDMGVRAVAAWALARHGKPEHAELIVPLLDPKNDPFVRLTAARSLQRLHNPKVIDALLKSTEPDTESDPRVRAAACTALGQYAQTRVLQGLIRATDDDALSVNTAALASLKTLTGQDLPADPVEWVKWLRDNKTPFANRGTYTYPAFERDNYWYEYIPFVAAPPNEKPGEPAGYSPLAQADAEADAAPAIPVEPVPAPGTLPTPAPRR